MPGLSEAFDRIGEAVEHHLPQTHAAGLALAVTDVDGTLGVVVRGFADVAAASPVRPETRFEIGSISKSFASVVCLQEAEAGRLDLDAPINELLPWLAMPEPFGPITLEHLLTHTSGLPIGTEESPTGWGAIAIARSIEPTSPPGTRFWYSNDGYKLVGMALERLTGAALPDLLRERILEPLGMSSSAAAITNAARLELAVGYEPAFDDRPPNLHHPLVPSQWLVSDTADGSIVSTVIDMGAYVRMLLGRGRSIVEGREVRLLSETSWKRLVEPLVDMDDDELPDARYGRGLWTYGRDGRRLLEHSGGMIGYTALMSMDVDAGIGCIALQNGSGDKHDVVCYALGAVGSALAGREADAPVRPAAPTSLGKAEDLEGMYRSSAGRSDSGSREIRLERTELGLRLVESSADVEVQLERWPDDVEAFLVPHPGWELHLLRLRRGPDGAVVELTHGPERFTAAGREPEPRAAHPESWFAFPGVYRSNDPWAPVVRVYLRAGHLYLTWPSEGDELELTPLDDGDTFAVGEPWTPRRARFQDEIDGSASWIWFNGGRWYRSRDEQVR